MFKAERQSDTDVKRALEYYIQQVHGDRELTKMPTHLVFSQQAVHWACYEVCAHNSVHN